MVYVGVVARLLNLDMVEVEKALRKQFARKVKAAELNWNAAKAGYDYATASLTKADPFSVERMDKTSGMIIIDGNSAAALGSMFAGVTVVTWYPITPSSSLVETLIEYMKAYRVGPDGKATFAIVQAEDELAAIGMVLGAGWAGARSMTATAGPGISLMAEFAGLGYYVEIPGVIWDIQRVGPSTGLPTRTSQGDIAFVARLSHGDTRHPMLIPSSVSECFSMASDAFDLTEQLQTPVFVMSDLDLGMNNWMSEPFQYPEKPQNRGKVLTAEDLERLGGFARYKDVDGDGDRLPHSARHRSFQRGLVRARQRSQREVAVQRASRRLCQQHGPAGAQVRALRAPWFPSRRWCATRGTKSALSPTAPRITRWSRPSTNCNRSTECTSTICACAPIPSPRRRTISSPRISGFTWSIRTATRRCTNC